METHQYTVKRPAHCSGTGLHTGKTVSLSIFPAPINHGIVFTRTDLLSRPAIPAKYDRVIDTTLATTLGDSQCQISTVEHLMAALHALGIDNAQVEVDAQELPIMDGSSWPFVELLNEVGRSKQKELRKYIRIVRPLSYSSKDKSIRIEPAKNFKISGSIDFDATLIKKQQFSTTITRQKFVQEIAKARTFGYVEQVEALWKNGLALGGTLDNVIAIHWNRRSVLNEGGLRYQNEFIRHKILDIVGDVALAGAPILGHIIANRSGHSLHHEFLQLLFDNPDCWEYITLPE